MTKEKGRSYRHRQIRTTGGRLVPNEEYDLQQGVSQARVRLLRDRSTDDELKFRLEVMQSHGPWLPGDRFTIVANWEGTGSWRIYDAGKLFFDNLLA